MTLYIQHGHGKAGKIDLALKDSLVNGIVFSPKNENPEKLADYINEVVDRYDIQNLFIDPQFQFTCIDEDASLGKLPKYDYFVADLNRKDFLKPKNISQYVKNCIDFQVSCKAKKLISPTINIKSFSDSWSQTSLQLADATESFVEDNNIELDLYHSFLISENAFINIDEVDDFLNILTANELAKGFYLTVDREDTEYSQKIVPELWGNVLYFIYQLSQINSYSIIVGYSDLLGLLYHAVGVEAICCGWHGSLRKYSTKRFKPSKGGKPPRPRYTSSVLLNSILVFPELDELCRKNMQEKVASYSKYDTDLLADRNSNWSLEKSTLHHWDVLGALTDELSEISKTSIRVEKLKEWIARAQNSYNEIESEGIVFDLNSNKAHLQQWERCLEIFEGLVDLT